MLIACALCGCRTDDRLKKDWASMKRYAAENAKLADDSAGQRVVFMGNSIIEGWSHTSPVFFENQSYINRGISGQTTSQMLVRFRQDVIELQPRVVLILAGTNDIAENTGPITTEKIAANIFSMAELSRANGIEPILCSVLPVKFYYWKKRIDPVPKIEALNGMIRTYCAANDIIFIDYYSSLVNTEKGLDWKYTSDGVHPNAEGYKQMEPLATAAITLALNRPVKSKDQSLR